MRQPSTKNPSRPTREWTRPVVDESVKEYPVAIAGFFGALTSVVFGLVITFLFVIATWLIAAHGDESVNQVLAASGIAWLGLQLVPISISGHVLGLLPWGFIIIPIFFTWRGTQWTLKSARPESAGDFWQCAGFFAISYGFLSAAVAAFASTNALSVDVVTSAIRSSLLALCVSVACVITYAPSRTILVDALPPSLTSGLRPGFVTFLFLIFCGAVLSTVALIIHFNEVSAVLQVMAPQAFDAFFLMLLCVGYVPTAVVWSTAYIIGPGINLGGPGIVSMTQVQPGSLPAFPLLSMLPNDTASWQHFFILLPIFAGIILYLLVPRDQWSAQGSGATQVFFNIIRPTEVITYVAAIFVTATCMFLVSEAASGPLGTDLLKFIGPQPLVVALTLALVLSVVVSVLLFVPRLLLSLFYLWQHRRSSEEIPEKLE